MIELRKTEALLLASENIGENGEEVKLDFSTFPAKSCRTASRHTCK